MSQFKSLKDINISNKNVIVRVDINVPMSNGNIDDDTRIKAIIPTIQYLIRNNAKVILISHFGRPEGKFNNSMSLQNILERLKDLLAPINILFVDDCYGNKVSDAVSKAKNGEVIMLENLRFYDQETKNDYEFSKFLASLADVYVNDAFSCSHRSHASITGIPSLIESCAGFQMEFELNNLSTLLSNPKKPMLAIVGGAKVSTKIDLLNSLTSKAQALLIGGGMANTFLYAMGINIGKSLCEKNFKNSALEIIKSAKNFNCEIILPSDVIVVKEFKENATYVQKHISAIDDTDIIVDIGNESIYNLDKKMQKFNTVVWNGPLGAFEIKPFNTGTESVAKIIAQLTEEKKLLSIAGGGDVVSALNSCKLASKFNYISTAGGAFLEWLEGKELPGILALNNITKN